MMIISKVSSLKLSELEVTRLYEFCFRSLIIVYDCIRELNTCAYNLNFTAHLACMKQHEQLS